MQLRATAAARRLFLFSSSEAARKLRGDALNHAVRRNSCLVLLRLGLLGLCHRPNPDRVAALFLGDVADEAPAGRQSQVLLEHEVRQEARDQQPVAHGAGRSDAICLSAVKLFLVACRPQNLHTATLQRIRPTQIAPKLE